LVALMLLALWNAGMPLGVVADATEKFATVDMQRLLRVQALSLQTEGVGSALVRLMNAPRDNRVMEYTDVDERNRRIDGIIESLKADLRDPMQEETLKQLGASRAVYGDAFLATVDQIEAEEPAAAARLIHEQVNPALKAMLVESNALLNRERERIEAQLAESQQLLQRIALTAAGSSLLVVALAVWLAWRTTRSVVVPLAELEAAAQRIAGGDYQSEVLSTRTEEVDRVGHALTMMTRAIAAREREIERLAFHDPLTDLPNRTFLLKEGAAAVAHSAAVAQDQAPGSLSLLLFDVARLKAINETLGFGTGDTLIKQVALRVEAVVRAHLAAAPAREAVPVPSATLSAVPAPHGARALLSHIAGGKFAIVLACSDRVVMEQLRERMVEATAEAVQCSGHRVDLTLVFGLADSAAGEATPIITLLRNAEVALDSAKQAGKGFNWYNPALEAARLSHLGLLSDLRAAVAQSQLQMWLQPKFSLQSGAAVGAEALVRWQHPSRGFVSPAEFVPFAERTGAITLVTDWMLDQALQTLQRWQHSHPHLSISVNVSTRDLQDSHFCQRVMERMRRYGIAPKKLRLEIVESGLMQDAHSSIAVLLRLRDAGVELSIDDFGTGYSSLAYLQQLPVSELKIDRSFVTDIDSKPGSLQLTKTMIEMGHGMGLLVTAEGIETAAERDTLAGLGCDVMQGYFGSRPLFGAKLQAWLEGPESGAASSAAST
jgi:predicted signal transduction protein with EAL and GGDEF domain